MSAFSFMGFALSALLREPIGFQCFRKTPKQRKPPDTGHRIQGAIISSDEDNLILTPCPKRVTSMCQQIDKHLESGTISPEQAHRSTLR